MRPTGSAPLQGWDGLAVHLARRDILENIPTSIPNSDPQNEGVRPTSQGWGKADGTSENFFVNCEELCSDEKLCHYVAERGWNKVAGEGRGRRQAQGWLEAWALWPGRCRASLGQILGQPGMDLDPNHPSTTRGRAGPCAPAVGGHVREDSKQELASVAWLEGGGDDDVAPRPLVRAQEDAA